MPRVKLSEIVNISGELTTCKKLFEENRAYVEKIENMSSRRSKKGYTTVYRIIIDDKWEFTIGKKAYESRHSNGFTKENYDNKSNLKT